LFRGIHFALRLIAKQDRSQFVALIVACNKFLLWVRSAQIDSCRLDAEITDKMEPQIEHFSPEIWDLLIADPFFSGHVRAGNEPLLTGVFPMRLPPHPAHDPVRIKREIADCENSLFFGLEIFRYR